VGRIALGKMTPRDLHLSLLPIATELIMNHGGGHRMHDMNPHYWELGIDAALDIITKCLLDE
jgi:hypothetical protein